MPALLVLAGFLVLCCLNVPIAVALGIVALAAMTVSGGEAALLNAAIVLYEGAGKFPLIAIPLFVLAGSLMNATSISRRLIGFCLSLVGFVRGGLAMVAIVSSMIFAEISGSSVADVAALGSILIPGMKARGYPKELAAAVMSSAASLAIIIPPSIPMILYAALADTSVVKLFVAGIIPGVFGGVMLMVTAYGFAVRYNLPRENLLNLKNIATSFWDAKLALMLPVIILGGIFGGIVTATEGGALAVVAALAIGLYYRELSAAMLRQALFEGVTHTAVVMLLVATSALLGVYLTETQIPQHLAEISDPDDPQPVGGFGDSQSRAVRARLLPARRCRHHSRGARGIAAGESRRHRPDPLRNHRYAQHRGGPADTAGGQRTDGVVLDCQGQHLGDVQAQRLFHRHADPGLASGDLYPGCLFGTGRFILWAVTFSLPCVYRELLSH